MNDDGMMGNIKALKTDYIEKGLSDAKKIWIGSMVKRLQKRERLNHLLRSTLVFLIKLNLLAIPMYMILLSNASFSPLQDVDARMSSAILNMFGYSTSVDGKSVNIMSNGIVKSIEISWDSTGWKSMYAIASLVLITPIGNINKRLRIAVLCVAIVFALNILRIASTIAVSTTFGFNLFDIIHTLLWREGMILAIVGIWIGWMLMEKYNIEKIK